MAKRRAAGAVLTGLMWVSTLASPVAAQGDPGAAPDTFKPFDKSSAPMLAALPANASPLDHQLYSRLNQDERDLLPCGWDAFTLEGAREAVSRGAAQALVAGSPTEGLQFGAAGDQLMQPLTSVYYGKLDKQDLWVSKYWGNGLFTAFVKAMPRALNDTEIYGGPATPLDHEDIRKDFKNSHYVVIEYRATPDSDTGLQSIIFMANTGFVKFKELYAASREYCTTWAHSPSVRVAGWKRVCEAGQDFHAEGIRMSGVNTEQDTMLTIGFVCA